MVLELATSTAKETRVRLGCINLIEVYRTYSVFSTDGRQSKPHLCLKGSQQSSERLAPSVGIFGHSAEILLESETDLAVISAACHDSGNGLYHCIYRTMVRAPAGQIGIKAIGHHGDSVGLSFQNRQFCYHGLGLSQLGIFHRKA